MNLNRKISSKDRNLYLAAGISIVVILSGIFILAVKYITPVYNGDITFVHDFSFYKTAAENFIENPDSLYTEKSSASELTYIYPPPAIFLFIPFAGLKLPLAYTLFLFISFTFLIAAIFFAVKTITLYTGKIDYRMQIIIYLTAVGNAPVYMNFQSSQVGTILIFIITLFIYFLIRKKYLRAGITLSLGVLLKLYPVFLLLAGIVKDVRKKFLSGFLLSLISVAVITLVVIPVGLYKNYFLITVPSLSSFTELNTYNQSLTAVILRLTDMYKGGWQLVEIPVFLRIMNIFVLLVILSFSWYKIFNTDSQESKALYLMIVSAAIPVFTTFGWGHIYILSLPLLLYLLFKLKSPGILFIFFLFAIDIPDSIFDSINIPLLNHLFHARFLLGTGILLVISYFHKELPLRKISLASA